MREADPDRSGSIEFKEFATTLKRQLRDGGGLADVVTEASSALGWLKRVFSPSRQSSDAFTKDSSAALATPRRR